MLTIIFWRKKNQFIYERLGVKLMFPNPETSFSSQWNVFQLKARVNAIEFLSAPCESPLILRYVSRNIYLRKTISTFNRYNICFRNYFAVELSKNNIFIILVEQLFMYHNKGCSLIFKGKLFYQMVLIKLVNIK